MTNTQQVEELEQQFVFDSPIPSLKVHSMKYNKKAKKWSYVYAFSTPELLTKSKSKTPLFIKGALQSLKLTYEKPAYMVFNEVRSANDLRLWLEKQQKCDLLYRKEYLEKHQDSTLEPKTIVLPNEDIVFNKDTYIVEEYKQQPQSTIFVGIQKQTINHYGVF